MNKIELLNEFRGTLYHNLLCFSENYLMDEPRENFVKEWEETKEKISLIDEIIKDENILMNNNENKSTKTSFSLEQILKMNFDIQYKVRNSNGGLLAGTVDLEDAKRCAEKYKKEYLQDSLNRHLGVYVYDKQGKNVYVAKGKELENEETEEFE